MLAGNTVGRPEITILPSSVFHRLLRFFLGGSDGEDVVDEEVTVDPGQ